MVATYGKVVNSSAKQKELRPPTCKAKVQIGLTKLVLYYPLLTHEGWLDIPSNTLFFSGDKVLQSKVTQEGQFNVFL